MGYLDSKGLQHAAWVTKNQTAQNWQMTKSKEAVTFYPAPQTELEPIVDFMFIETPPASGEKSPTNPSTINGVSSVKVGRCGANLCLGGPQPYNLSFVENGWYSGTVDNTNGTETVYAYLNYGYYAKVDPEKSYCVVVECENCDEYGIGTQHNVYPAALITRTYGDHNTVSGTGKFKFDLNHTRVANPGYILRTSMPIEPGETKTFKFRVAVFQCKASQIDLNSYEYEEPPASWITTVALNDTYYGGSLNFKTGELTVTHNCILARATNTSDGYAQTSINGNFAKCIIRTGMPTKYDNSQLCCTRFPTSTDASIERVCVRGSDAFWSVACLINKSRLDFSNSADPNNPTGEEIATAFDTWLQTNPTYVAFQRTEPLIVQLTPQQILSLPQPDKYTPRINTVYTDQKSVRVGYRRLDCIELRSDQTIHGEKTFADSPLVPNPDNLDSQQAAPISFVKDMLRAEVEAMSGGKNTIIRDQWNNPHVMVRIPKFLLKDIDSSWPNEPHPAFIVNGVQKSEIFIGKYLASQSSSGKAQTLPRQAPWTQINFDNALSSCRSLGPGFCLNTNASWAARALWLWKTLGESHEYLGNGNYGRDYTYHELTGTMKDSSYVPGNTSITDAVTLTGTGGIKWNDDETAYGIADFVGNVLEWIAGFRLNNGEIQIIQDNNACLSTCDMSALSTEWKAILQDGSFVSPETANTLKYDGSVADATTSWNVAGTFRLNTEIINQNIKGFYGALDFKNMIAYSGVIVPNILKQLAIFPISNVLQGYCWACNKTERFLGRGGGAQNNHPYCGPFAFSFNNARTYTARTYGFRTAYIA